MRGQPPAGVRQLDAEKYVLLGTETVQHRTADAVPQALQELYDHDAKCKAEGLHLSQQEQSRHPSSYHCQMAWCQRRTDAFI